MINELPPGYAAEMAARVAFWDYREREKAKAAEAAKREAIEESFRCLKEIGCDAINAQGRSHQESDD